MSIKEIFYTKIDEEGFQNAEKSNHGLIHDKTKRFNTNLRKET